MGKISIIYPTAFGLEDQQVLRHTMDHSILREIVKQRVSDGVINRMLGKWLNAGVMEKGNREYREQGTPQGEVISPLLSNIYLHEVIDSWIETTVKPRMFGKIFVLRYADDAVIGCSDE